MCGQKRRWQLYLLHIMSVTLINISGLPIKTQGPLDWKTKVYVIPFHTQLYGNKDLLVKTWQH